MRALCLAPSKARLLSYGAGLVLTLHSLPAAAAQLDDVLVVGYGEWEDRKALESHLQKGADFSAVYLSQPVGPRHMSSAGWCDAGSAAQRSAAQNAQSLLQ